MLRHFATVLGILSCSACALAQQPPEKSPWTVLTDPVCPVAAFYDPPQPNVTRELRVMYFPANKNAKLKDPQSLNLHIGFNRPSQGGRTAAIPFARKEDHWEATVPVAEFRAMYAIFLIRDDKTGELDDNGGQFWDVVFCGANGGKDANSVMAQAQGYAGESWSATLRRARNYDKAIAILRTAMTESPDRSSWWLTNLWKIEAQRDGKDTKAWAKVATEIEEYARDRQERRDLYWIGHFVVEHQDQLPADFVERIIAAADAKNGTPKDSLQEESDYYHALREPDADKRLAAFDAFVGKYPKGSLYGPAQYGRFDILLQRKDVAKSEAALAAYREATKPEAGGFPNPNDYFNFLAMARLYIEKGVKLNEALKLVDLAQGWLQSDPRLQKFTSRLQPQVEAHSMLLRALAYLALKQPGPALEQIRKSFEIRKSPESYSVLAKALAANGEKRAALDAYFEAALRPSNKDLQYTAELEDFYLKNHLGNRRQFGVEMDKRRAERFRASGYKPEVVDQPAPDFEFVTLAGESFDADKLSSKTVIVNFWSPG